MRRLVVLLLLAAGYGAAAASPAAAQAGALDSEAECTALADSRLPEWTAAGLPKDEIQRRWRLAAASCAGAAVDSGTAVFMGRLNVDYYRLAALLFDKAITSGEYELRLRDRAQKQRLARTQPGFIADWIKGDQDGDLIADLRDLCPGTRHLEPTDDRGCSSAYRPPGYGDNPLVHQVLGRMGLMRSRLCDGALQPEMPTPLSMTFVAPGELHIVISRVRNQPAGCPTFYEISADSDGWVPGNHRYAHLVLRESESVIGDPDRVEFHLDWSSVGGRLDLMNHFVSSNYTSWHARAVNGNGLASNDSMPRRSP